MGAAYPEFGTTPTGPPAPQVPGPLGVFATLGTALALYGADLGRLWAAMAVVIVPVQLLVFVLRIIAIPHGAVMRNGNIYFPAGASNGGYSAVTALGGLLTALIVLVSIGAAYRILLGRHLHHPADLMTSFSFALDRVFPLFWVSLLTAIIVFLGFIFLIIPGIYLMIALALAVPVLMAEHRGGFNALGRSAELVRGHWWHVLGCVFLAALVAVAAEVVAGLVAGAIVGAIHSIAAGLLVNALLDALASILFSPFTAAVAVVLYVDMLVRKQDPQLDRLLA